MPLTIGQVNTPRDEPPAGLIEEHAVRHQHAVRGTAGAEVEVEVTVVVESREPTS